MLILGSSRRTRQGDQDIKARYCIDGGFSRRNFERNFLMISFCLESSLDKEKARGKILVCRHSGSSSESKLAKGMAVKNAGGVGMILIDEINADVATPFIIPAAAVGKVAGEKILSYVNSTRSAE